MKKIVSLAVILMLALSILSVVSFASGEEYTDFVRGSINDNLVVNFKDSFWHANTLNDSRVSLTGINWKNSNPAEGWPGGYLGASMTAKEDIPTVPSHYGSAGMAISTSTNATYPKIEKDADSYVIGESYVFMFAARNINPDVPASIRVGVFNNTYSGVAADDFLPVTQYPNGVIELPQSGEWVVVKTILPASPNRAVPGLRVGFVAGTKAGAAVEFNSRHPGVQQAYYAKETAHDIKVNIISGTAEEMKAESQISLEASVYNQLDQKGSLSQDFTWTVLAADGSVVQDGYTITHDSDSSRAVFTNTNLPNGTYNIVATSKEYGISRFTPITVSAKFELSEYVSIESDDNLIIDPTRTSMISTGTSNQVTSVTDSGLYPQEYTLTAIEDLTSVAHSCYNHGFLYRKGTPEGGYVAGDKYLYSVWVKNDGEQDSHIVVALSNAYDIPMKYGSVYGADGMTVPADGKWYEYREILTVPGAKPILSLGMPVGTKAGEQFTINLNKVGLTPSYFAKEVINDIVITPSATKASEGETIDLGASVVNQFGMESSFNQNFTWYVLDANKNYKFSGYTLSQNGKTAQLTVTGTKAEEIYVVAVSEDYNMVRMLPISLNGSKPIIDYVKGDKPANLIIDPTSKDNFADASANYDVVQTGNYRLELSSTFTAKNVVSDYGSVFNGASGFIVKNSAMDLTTPLKGGKAYVFGASVKNVNGTGDIVLDAGLTNTTSYGKAAKPIETSNGYVIPAGDDWHNIVATMKMPGTEGTDYSPYLTFGFGIGTDAGDKFELNRLYETADKIYFAPEEAYDIVVENLSGNMTVAKGSEISLKAKMLNQLGSTGYLDQKFTWYIKADDFTDANSLFTITEDKESATLTITPKANAKGGKYTVVAKSDSYNGFARFETIVVSDETTTLYVATNGNNSWNGTQDAPLRTLSGAVAKLEELRRKGITVNEVIFMPGEYIFTETASFTKADRYEIPVTFRAMEEGTVIFKTSVELDNGGFELVEEGDIVARFAPGMVGKIYAFDLAAAGYTPEDITDVTQINGQYGLTSQGEFNTLYYNGYEQTVAQWPDGGEYAVKGDNDQYNGDEANAKDGLSFTYYRSDVANMLPAINCDRWGEAKNFWISSFEPYDYAKFRYYVKDIDTENHVITICDKPAELLSNKRSGRWKAHNLIEEITLPGEYAIDIENMMLYYYPQGNLNGADIEFSSFTGAMINLTDAKNIIFDSITFTQTRDDAISMTDVSDIQIVNCTFEDIASSAISGNGSRYADSGRDSWQAQRVDGLYDVIIKGNNFENIGQTAVQVQGAGNIDTLTDSGVVVEDNFIHNTSNKSFWEAIILGGCAVTVRGNSVSSVPMQAIRAWGNNHLIEYNEIFDVITEDADCAAIYWGGSSIYQGTVVRYNYIHDTDGELPGGQVGIYWDDMQLGQTAKYNILANQGIDFNSNGAGATVHHYNTTYKAEKHINHHDHGHRSEDTITRDLNYESLEAIRNDIADLGLFYTRYPYLKNVIEDANNPTKYTSIIGNLGVDIGDIYLRENAPKYAVIEGNIQLDSTDAFNDIDAQDFRLRADSDLAKENPHLLNTENFDIEKIGLARDYEMGDFSLVYPGNRASITDYGTGVTLMWTSAKGANRYNVVVATDPDFNDVVYETETLYNSVTLPLLPVDTYYWKVSAKSISREFAGEWEAENGERFFTISEITVPIYVDSEISATNAIADPSEATNYNQFNTSSIYPLITDSKKSYSLTVKSAFVETASHYGNLSGLLFRTSGGDYIDPDFKVPGGEKLILKIPVKNSGLTSSVRLNAALINSGNWNTASYSLEYGAEGVVVSDKNNWTELVFTFIMPGTPGVEYTPRLTFGFTKDTSILSAIKINLANEGVPQVFVGRAEPLEIDLSTTTELPVKPGGSMEITAMATDLTSTYDASTSEDIKWYVTNFARTGIMDNPGDFTFVNANGKKLLKLGANVQPGEYYVIAESVQNPNLRKGMFIAVSPADITVTEPVLSGSTISYTLTYYGDTALSFNTYVAGYDINGNLVFANPHEIKNAVKDSSHNIESTVPEGKLSECAEFKIFTWKDGLVPLAGGLKKFYKED